MTDRRDTDEELATLLSELEETLTQLRGTLDEEDRPVNQPGRERRREAGWQERPPFPRPPSMRELLRFTEQQTIPTLVSILEVHIRLLNFAAAALRAVDPDRSVTEPDERGTVSRALDAGGGLSADRLASGLGDLQAALAGAEAPNPEARQLLNDAERLSQEVRERVREREGGRLGSAQSEAGAADRTSSEAGGPVHIEVEDATGSDDDRSAEDDSRQVGNDDADSGVDVDAELDSIREEVRGETDEDSSEGDGDSDDDADANPEADTEDE